MTIYLHSVLAGPAGVRHPGKHDLPDAEAQALIDAGYAEPFTEAHAGPEAAVMPVKEVAMLPRPVSTASRKPKVTPPATTAPSAPPATTPGK